MQDQISPYTVLEILNSTRNLLSPLGRSYARSSTHYIKHSDIYTGHTVQVGACH